MCIRDSHYRGRLESMRGVTAPLHGGRGAPAHYVFHVCLDEGIDRDAVLARGHEYGQSRAVCNVHWHSDVVQGRVVASALYARLHADAEFRADLDAARAEVESLRAEGSPAPKGCAAEAQALAANAGGGAAPAAGGGGRRRPR